MEPNHYFEGLFEQLWFLALLDLSNPTHVFLKPTVTHDFRLYYGA
jgi:hypothetical protein